jgi:hypothetical protein
MDIPASKSLRPSAIYKNKCIGNFMYMSFCILYSIFCIPYTVFCKKLVVRFFLQLWTVGKVWVWEGEKGEPPSLTHPTLFPAACKGACKGMGGGTK